jgi:hypothetical protein
MKHGPKHKRRQNCRARIDSTLSIPVDILSTSGTYRNNVTGASCQFVGDVVPGSRGSIESLTSTTRECVLVVTSDSQTTLKKVCFYASRSGFRLSSPATDGIRTAYALRDGNDEQLARLCSALSADTRTRNRWEIEFRNCARNGTGTDNHKSMRLHSVVLTDDPESKSASLPVGPNDENARRRDYSQGRNGANGSPMIDSVPTANEYDHSDTRISIGADGRHEDRHSETT